jgi:hypothetical protein|tara:strand:- start:248 stop:457 length:210 start_codon:yes stop_codon:yes gene_type:complete
MKSLFDKTIQLHHKDIHEELDVIKQHQVKSKWYYIFWGIATVSVVAGQIYVGSGYHQMSNSIMNYIESK